MASISGCQNRVAKVSEEIIFKINEMLLPEVPNLLVFFDDEDARNYLNPLFEAPAFFRNLEIDSKIEFCPSHLQREIDITSPKFLIWVSKDICLGDPIRMAWVYSHQIQHLNHDLSDIELSKLSCFLYRFYRAVKDDATWIDIPTELDCERTAFNTVKKIFSKDQFEKYQASLTGNVKADYGRFLKNNATFCRGIKEEFANILFSGKSTFEMLQETHIGWSKETRVEFGSYFPQ